MQENRPFRILYYLLAHGKATAPELAQKFEVSTRTIYRDMDTLSGAGIPVYALPGKGGGLRILGGHTLERALLTPPEREQLLMALQGFAATGQDTDGLLTKLGALFQMHCPPWIEVDLSGWAQGQPPQETFETVKTAIFQRRVLSFCYFGSRGKSENRTARPLRLVFKNRDWYLYAFCLLRKDYRFFKLTRIRDLAIQAETFPPGPVPGKVAPAVRPERTVTVTLKFDRAAAFRVYDEFTAPITEDPQGNLYVQAELPEHERLYSYLLSFADQVEVLAPPPVREELKARLQKMQEKYKT